MREPDTTADRNTPPVQRVLGFLLAIDVGAIVGPSAVVHRRAAVVVVASVRAGTTIIIEALISITEVHPVACIVVACVVPIAVIAASAAIARVLSTGISIAAIAATCAVAPIVSATVRRRAGITASHRYALIPIARIVLRAHILPPLAIVQGTTRIARRAGIGCSPAGIITDTGIRRATDVCRSGGVTCVVLPAGVDGNAAIACPARVGLVACVRSVAHVAIAHVVAALVDRTLVQGSAVVR